MVHFRSLYCVFWGPSGLVKALFVATLLPSSSLASMDRNGDGVSDFWTGQWPAAVLDGVTDSDGDGATDLEEALAGSHPFDRSSCFVAKLDGPPDEARNLSVGWDSIFGKRYFLERWSQDSGEWEDIAGPVDGLGGPATFVLHAPDPSGLYRVRVEDVDDDGDGLSAWEEHLLGWSDDSGRSSGQSGRLDYAAAFRSLEGSGNLPLVGGGSIQKSLPTEVEAARLLFQASFGPDLSSIADVQEQGIGGWLDSQRSLPVTTSSYARAVNGVAFSSTQWKSAWWKLAMSAPDQLRQRMGYALSQILVVSTAGGNFITNSPHLQAQYYDHLLYESLGSYRSLLERVTYSTEMGLYLSHLKNRKADPNLGRFPDENYAREIMQLFSIGLWELNPDGSRKLDLLGQPIPTYDNETIEEMAKVFTGFSYGHSNATSFFSNAAAADWLSPMKMWDDEHESGTKTIIGGVVIPAGQTGDEDVAQTLDVICAHPNIGPFIGRLLIQRLVCSNPSPAYIRRVGEVWSDNGSGVAGDMAAVAEAILLDPEARMPDGSPGGGKVIEPYLRLVAVMRAFDAKQTDAPSQYPISSSFMTDDLGQQPLESPTVFNFYLPDHRPDGSLRDAGLVAPELGIATSYRLIATDNLLSRSITAGLNWFASTDNRIYCDFGEEVALAGDIDALLDHLDLRLTRGMLSQSTRVFLRTAALTESDLETRVQRLVHLLVETPDFVVLK